MTNDCIGSYLVLDAGRLPLNSPKEAKAAMCAHAERYIAPLRLRSNVLQFTPLSPHSEGAPPALMRDLQVLHAVFHVSHLRPARGGRSAILSHASPTHRLAPVAVQV